MQGSGIFAKLVGKHNEIPQMAEIVENDVVVVMWQGARGKPHQRICRVKWCDGRGFYITDSKGSDDVLSSTLIKDMYIVKR